MRKLMNVFAAFAAVAVAAAHAQQYPAKTIRLIVPTGARARRPRR